MSSKSIKDFFLSTPAPHPRRQSPVPLEQNYEQHCWTSNFDFDPSRCILQTLEDRQPPTAKLLGLPQVSRAARKIMIHTSALGERDITGRLLPDISRDYSMASGRNLRFAANLSTHSDLDNDDMNDVGMNDVDMNDDDDFETRSTNVSTNTGVSLTAASRAAPPPSTNTRLRVLRSYTIWGCSICGDQQQYKHATEDIRSMSIEKHIRVEHGKANWGKYCYKWGDKEFYSNGRTASVSVAMQQAADALGINTPGYAIVLKPLPPQAEDNIDNSIVFMCPKPGCFEARSRRRDLPAHMEKAHREINLCKSILGIPRSSVQAQKIAYGNQLDISHVDLSALFPCAWCDTLSDVKKSRYIESRRICDVCRAYYGIHKKRRPAILVALERAKQLILLAARNPNQSVPLAPRVSAYDTAVPATAVESTEIDSELQEVQPSKRSTGKPREKQTDRRQVINLDDDEQQEQTSKRSTGKPRGKQRDRRQVFNLDDEEEQDQERTLKPTTGKLWAKQRDRRQVINLDEDEDQEQPSKRPTGEPREKQRDRRQVINLDDEEEQDQERTFKPTTGKLGGMKRTHSKMVSDSEGEDEEWGRK